MVRLNPAAITVRGSYEDTYAAFGPPRSGKSNWMAQVGLEAPGACLFTSTRADLARDTALARRRGDRPVHFLNPGLDGGFPSTLRYTPLAGCGDQRMAMESAGALMHAAPRNTDGASNWIDAETKFYLQYLLHAAVLGRADIFTVRHWAAVPSDAGGPVKILDAAGKYRWAESLDAVSARARADFQYAQGLAGGVAGALAWLDDPALEDLASPAPGAGFDARQFIRDQGSVYLIGADSPNCSLSPYFACFATCLWNTAKRMAADPAEPAAWDLRLDPPLTMIIDEPMITCPVPLDRWVTEAAGHGITLVTGFQSDAQLRDRFGEHGGQALEDMFTVKLVFRGVTGAIAERASGWAGKRDTWHGSKANLRQEPVFPPERICNLDLGEAFVKHRGTRAFVAGIGRVRHHPLYEKAEPGDFPFSLPAAQPALEPASQRDAITLALLYLVLLRSARFSRWAVKAPPAITVNSKGVASWPSPAAVSSAA